MNSILLDPSIRNWVLLPILFITILIGLCRHFVMVLFKNDTNKDLNENRYQYIYTNIKKSKNFAFYFILF